jgi:zinc protease
VGGSFSGLILQEIREYRSLAYTANGSFIIPKIQGAPAYFNSYMGCQADKTNEAIETMYNIINNMPQKPERIDLIKSLLINSASAYYPNFRSISSSIENYRQRGYNSAPIKDEYTKYDTLTFGDIENFYENYIKNKPVVITIYGNKSKMNLVELSKYGKIMEIKKSDIVSE